MTVLKAAIIGLGWWGTQIGHVLKGNEKIQIVVGVDLSEDVRTAWSAATGLPTIASFEEALNDDGIDAVIIVTPHSTHEALVVQAAEKGKQIFCEKPLALTGDSARRMITACEQRGIVLGVGHERRYEPGMEEVHRLVTSGDLGTIMHFEANYSHDKFLALGKENWRGNPTDAPAAGWTGMGVHLTDAMLAMVGPVKELFASSAQRVLDLPSGDVVTVQMTFENGATSIIGCVSATPFYGRFAVFGSKGWVETRELAHTESPVNTQLITCFAGQSQTLRELAPIDTVRANFEAWADAAQGRGEYRFTNEEKFANTAIMEAITKSIQSGQPQALASL